MKASLDKREKPRATPQPPLPAPRPARPVASPPAAVKGEATSVLCCSVLSCLITRLHFLVLKGSARTQALAALSPASPLGRGAGDAFRGPHGQAHLVPPGNPPASEPPRVASSGIASLRGAWHGPPHLCSPRLLIGTVAPPHPAPHRSAVRRRGGGRGPMRCSRHRLAQRGASARRQAPFCSCRVIFSGAHFQK